MRRLRNLSIQKPSKYEHVLSYILIRSKSDFLQSWPQQKLDSTVFLGVQNGLPLEQPNCTYFRHCILRSFSHILDGIVCSVCIETSK